MKKTTKRLLAAVLCLVMVLGALPLTALAEEVTGGTAVADVVYGNYSSGTWSQDATNTTGTSVVDNNITLKKTATKTADNQYEVTLEVQLKQTSTTTSAAAATTLVFDLSNSMKWCMVCGENHYASNHKTYREVTSVQTYGTYYIKEDEDQYTRVYYCDGDHVLPWNDHAPGWYRTELLDHEESNRLTPKTEENSEGTPFYTREQSTSTDKIERLKTAKEAAISFLQTYSGLTGFNENGTTTATQNQNLQRYFSLVTFGSSATKQSFSAGGNLYWVDVSNPQSFNTVVGIINDLETSGATNLDAGLRRANELMQENTVKNIQSAHKNVIAMTDGAATYYVSVNDGKETNVAWHSDNGCPHTNEVTEATAATLKSSIGSLYTVCVSASSVSCYVGQQCSYSHWNSPTVGAFLRDSIATAAADGKTYAYNANNQSELLGAFSSIAETVTTGLNAGTVTDNLPAAGVTTTSTDFVEGVMSWELDPAEATTSTAGDTTTYTYTKTYTVTIDPDTATTVDGYAPLNGETTFTYTDATGEYEEHFPIPAGRVTPNVKYKLTYKNPLVTADADYVDDDITATSVTLASSYSNVSFNAPTETGHTIVFIGWSETAPTAVLDKGDTVPTLVTSVTFSEQVTEKTVYAVWGYDDIGGESGGNDTPDVFDGTVTFKVVNGSWSNTTSDTERTVTKPLYEKNSDNEWVAKTDVELETGDIPSVDSVVAFSGYKKPGTWGTEPKDGDAFVDGTTYTYTLPALGSYTVTYNANTTDTVTSLPSSQTKTEGAPLTLVAGDPSRANYTFNGWNTQADGNGDSYTNGDSYVTDADLTLYAQWQENEKYTYTLKYNANGGAGAPGDDVYPTGDETTYDESHTFNVSSTEPTRANYTFLGWADSADATTAQYTSDGSDGTAATVTLTKNAPTKTIYAVWLENDKNVYTLTYNANAGSDTVNNMPTNGSAQTHDLSHTFTVNTTTTPVRDGYEFLGWANTANASAPDYTSTSNTVTVTKESPSKVVYAVWERLLPELSVAKTVYKVGNTLVTSQQSIPTAQAGDTVIWKIVVTNSGNVAGTAVLTDMLGTTPITTFYSDDACTQTATDFTVGTGNSNTATYYVKYDVTADDVIGSTLVNSVKVGNTPQEEPTPGVPVGGLTVEKDVTSVGGEYDAEVEFPVNPANARAAATTSEHTAKVGDTITWTITVKNYFDTAQTFTLTDELTGDRDVTLGAPVGGTYADGVYTVPAADRDANGGIEPTVMTITATYVVQESDEGTTLVNTAIIKQDDKEIDKDNADGVEVEGKLSVSKKVATIKRGNDTIYDSNKPSKIPEAKIGDQITWEITVSNTGNATIQYKLADALEGRTGLLTIYNKDRDAEIGADDNQTLGPREEETAVPTSNTYYVDYTVTPSDYGETLTNVVTVTEKTDDGSDKTHTDKAEPIEVEDKPNTPSYNPNYNAGVQLEKGEHFNYVIGYSDGTVRPEGNITRAEVATIFFRLLTDESRKTYLTEYNTFTDVEKSMWHNVAISTLARAGVLNGYNDGSFRPDNNITRAEMAAIISRFAELEGSTRISFTDIKGHWAEKSILLAASNGWINGYNDGSFRPDQNITRAETFAMINRVLERKVEHVNDLVSDMNTWVDNMDTTQWYYFDVQEATNYHSYERKYTNTKAEKWIKKLTDIDWTVYQY